MNLKQKVLTGNPTGNSRCQALASRALNTSCNFGQSARSIESRCVVMQLIVLAVFGALDWPLASGMLVHFLEI